MEVKIKNEYPPNIEDIKKHFTLHKDIVFAYGDTLYNPDNATIDKPMLRHEKTHCKQQGDNPKEWWDRYLVDVDFRLSQEVEAFQWQYRVAKSEIKDRESLNRYLNCLAKNLSSKLYGDLITFSEAMEAIKAKEIYKFNV